MKSNQQNKVVRFILRTIDIMLPRVSPRVHWNADPFQNATKRKKRFGGLFMAVLPAFVALFFGWLSLSMTIAEKHGRFSLILLYVALLCVSYYVIAVSLRIAPKTPLSVSVPIAIVTWASVAWMIWKTWL